MIPMNPDEAARQLVERSRAGDQVAIAWICEVRKNCKTGDPRWKNAAKALQRYIDKNPPSRIGADREVLARADAIPSHPAALAALWVCRLDTDEQFAPIVVCSIPVVALWKCVSALVQRPYLNRLCQTIDLQLEGAQRAAFRTGVRQWRRKGGSQLGRVIGLARTIQRLQLPGVPISTLCPITAWELGE